jgi:hypothetical protein
MKKQDLNSRRNFLNALVLGTAASGLSMLSNGLNAALPLNAEVDLNDAEKWMKNLKGKHRIVYDGSTPHDGFPFMWVYAFYSSNNAVGVEDRDIKAMCVIRHKATCFAFQDSVWEKFKFGEVFGVTDKYTGEASLRNLYYEPKENDFPLPNIPGIKTMKERGALYCVCNLATQVFSGMIAARMGLKADDVYKEMIAGLIPGVQLVPSGVWALGRAQENGTGYIFAGD